MLQRGPGTAPPLAFAAVAEARILVVEDDPGIASGLERALTAEHYIVDIARTGAEALRLAMHEPANEPDLVLLDLGPARPATGWRCAGDPGSETVDAGHRVDGTRRGARRRGRPRRRRRRLRHQAIPPRRVAGPPPCSSASCRARAATGDDRSARGRRRGPSGLVRRQTSSSCGPRSSTSSPRWSRNAGPRRAPRRADARRLGRELLRLDEDARRPHGVIAPQARQRPVGPGSITTLRGVGYRLERS